MIMKMDAKRNTANNMQFYLLLYSLLVLTFAYLRSTQNNDDDDEDEKKQQQKRRVGGRVHK